MKIYGYVASYYDAALVILDLSNPTSPTLLGTLRGGGSPNYLEYPIDVVVDYPYAYVVDNAYSDGFNIFDIRRPSAITRVGGILVTDPANPSSYFQRCYTIIKSGNTVYVVGNDGLIIVDVTDVTAPTILGAYTDRRGYFAVLSETTIFMTSSNRLCFLDIEDPTNPTLISTKANGGAPNYLSNTRGLYKVGNVLFVCAEGSSALTAWDVTNPRTTPTQLGVIRGGDAPNYLRYPQQVIVRDNLAYVAVQGTTRPGLTIIDVTDPVSMSYHGGSYSTDYLWSPWDMKLYGRYAYLCGYADGVSTVDISDPTSPTVAGNIQGAGAPNYLEYCAGMDIHVFGAKGNPHIDQLIYQHVERMDR